ncbi:MAG: HAMP domain-containing histidine kinase [bacterium]|nr:HAMP domain-containing histidine kinase [bacterium]
MKLLKILKRGLKHHGHHLIFGISILSLMLLAAWWSVFLNQSVENQRKYSRETLEATLNFFSLHLRTGNANRPKPGMFKEDERFEIAACGTRLPPFAKSLQPSWPDLCIRVREPVLTGIEENFKRKKVMVVGESGLLVLLILMSSILLYQFIQLERRSTREMEEFWGRVTHEIKTPITGVKAFLQSLKNQSISPDQLPVFVDMALKQVEKQEKLAENILAGYGLRSGKNEYALSMKNMDIVQCIEDYFNGHGIRLTDAEVFLNLEGGKGLFVRVDCKFFRIILDNIVDNALRYCSPGLVLDVNVSKEDREAVIAVSDNGPGIPSQFSEKIFSAYKHLGSELPGNKHGSGMGMYISRRLAEKMGGRLEASGKSDKCGAVFKLFLNLAEV